VHEWSENGSVIRPELHTKPIMYGHLYDDSFGIDRTLLTGVPLIARADPDLFLEDGTQKKRYDFDDDEPLVTSGDGAEEGSGAGRRLPAKVALEAISLAHRIQVDLETVLVGWIRYFKETTGESNVCLAGGVALNSVLNGRVSRKMGFDKTFISPYPGDDGIAVGCCAYGLFGSQSNDLEKDSDDRSVPLWDGPLSPYLGPDPNFLETRLAVEYAEPWLEIETVTNEDKRLTIMAEEIESGGVVAWYHSRVSHAVWFSVFLIALLPSFLTGSLYVKSSRRLAHVHWGTEVSWLIRERRDWFDLLTNT